MTKVTLRNDFHNSEARVSIPASPAAVKRAMRKLCGIAGCTCGSIRGPIVDDRGYRYAVDEFDGRLGILRVSKAVNS